MVKILLIFPFVLLCDLTKSELYTSISDLEQLVQTETVLISTLQNYIDEQEQKLGRLRKYTEVYQNHYDEASEDIQSYLANPVNAYLMVKRLTADWRRVENIVYEDVGLDLLKNLSQHHDMVQFPSDEDLNGAAAGLARLQDTYRLDTSSLANGEINGVQYTSALTAADCFELGRQSYNNEDFYHAGLWMTEADVRLKREENKTIERSVVLDYLSYTTFKLGNITLALDLTNKLLDLIPTHQRALNNKLYFEKEIPKADSIQIKAEVDDLELERRPESEMQVYQRLCRGEGTIPETVQAKLKCSYRDNGNPFLKIAPFKVEEVYPSILIFYDILYEEEIATMKRLAQPRLRREKLISPVTGGELSAPTYRTSKWVFFGKDEHPVIEKVLRRGEDMTGLTVETAEPLQVVNYGIGGHYEPHYDFVTKETKTLITSLLDGNRIATMLLYISDVAQGGATAFPNIDIAVWPKKASAVFWYNLHPNGEGHTSSRHAACPVLAGSKWVSSILFHEHGQEFRRPCGLTRPPPELTV